MSIKIGPEYLDKMAEALSKYPQQNPSSLVVDNRPRKDIIHFKTFINDEGEEDEYVYDQNFEHDVEVVKWGSDEEVSVMIQLMGYYFSQEVA